MDWKKEPVMVLVGGGTTLVQAFIQLLIAFGVPINGAQQAAITTLVTIILGLLARTQVTPMSSLPAGVAGDIAEEKAVRAADRAKAAK
jgi:hypothetical protein